MRLSSWLGSTTAAALALASAGQASAAFTAFAQPSTTPAPAGRYAVDFFAVNDSNPTDGIALQAVAFTFTGLSGTRAFFASEDLGDGTRMIDTWNFIHAGSSTIRDPAFGNLRLGTRNGSAHAFVNTPGDTDSPATDDEMTNGFASFTADYALLNASQAVPANTPPYARFARLVFNTPNPSFTLSGSMGGEAGVAQPFQVGWGPPLDLVITPSEVTVDVSPAGLEGFGPVTARVQALGIVESDDPRSTPLPITDIVIPAILRDNIQVSNTSLEATLMGSGLTYEDLGTHEILFEWGSQTKVFTLHVIPEPTSLASTGLCLLAAARRSRRP